ncbi:hypothetical protein L2E82_29810 [Cichorium intybus]|uniref:Uncharacterized protein n=1 Tax=Cichorium intybus TaxID=13427 RepID=A0ACB9CYZ7_CICIN|nr:hypothetical protein L2E82_29810 [Cichorium intybus]
MMTMQCQSGFGCPKYKLQKGPLDNLVSSGCFGSFPSHVGWPNNPSKNSGGDHCNTYPGGSDIKRKRAETLFRSGLSHWKTIMIHDVEPQSRTETEHGDVDLNCTPQNSSSTEYSSQDKEVEAKVNVGAKLDLVAELRQLSNNEIWDRNTALHKLADFEKAKILDLK